jgi:hypothetical protein
MALLPARGHGAIVAGGGLDWWGHGRSADAMTPHRLLSNKPLKADGRASS